MKHFLVTVAGVLVGLVLFMVLAPMLLLASLSGASQKAATPSNVVLTLDMRGAMTDQRSQSPFAAFNGGNSVVETVRKLAAAAGDSKIKGVFVRANTGGMAPSASEEIRTALAAFRKSGKFVIAHIQVDGLQSSIAGYSAVAGADEVWLQETGGMMPMGIVSEATFLGGAFEKFSANAEFEQREQYKNAVNQFTQKDFTPAHREAAEGMIGSLYDSFVAHIAADRRLTVEAAKAAIEGTPYTGKDAVTHKLVDQLGRPEDAQTSALDRAGKDSQVLDIAQYDAPGKESGAPVIAFIGAEGDILSGRDKTSPLADSAVINSDTVSKAFADAADDKNVRAIIFRISSPGGSAVASDQILHALQKAREKGKKVVVSMGAYAASGGYYVSADADSIVASPTTITGSIGIFGGKIVLGKTLEKYAGIRSDSVLVGSPLANMFTPSEPFTNAQREAFATMIDEGYADFLGAVANGRKMSVEQVRAVAKGRVWTGVQAKERGLVDELGGLDTAIARAKALAGIDAKQTVTLKLFPSQKGPIEFFQQLFGASDEAARGAVLIARVMSDPRVVAAMRPLEANTRGALRAEAPPIAIR